MALVFSFIAAQPCPCQEKTGMVGVELMSFLYRQAELGVSYSFGQHWTITGEASISYEAMLREKSEIESAHDNEFTSSNTIQESGNFAAMCASFSYWPKSAFSGPYISMGVHTGKSLDAILDAGYMINIWKGICISTAIRLIVIHKTQTLRIGIHYKF